MCECVTVKVTIEMIMHWNESINIKLCCAATLQSDLMTNHNPVLACSLHSPPLDGAVAHINFI